MSVFTRGQYIFTISCLSGSYIIMNTHKVDMDLGGDGWRHRNWISLWWPFHARLWKDLEKDEIFKWGEWFINISRYWEKKRQGKFWQKLYLILFLLNPPVPSFWQALSYVESDILGWNMSTIHDQLDVQNETFPTKQYPNKSHMRSIFLRCFGVEQKNRPKYIQEDPLCNLFWNRSINW